MMKLAVTGDDVEAIAAVLFLLVSGH